MLNGIEIVGHSIAIQNVGHEHGPDIDKCKTVLFLTLGIRPEAVLGLSRIYREFDGRPGGYYNLICELKDADSIAYWTDNGKGRVVNGHTIIKYEHVTTSDIVRSSLLDLEELTLWRTMVQASVDKEITKLHSNIRFSKEAQHLFWHSKGKSIPLTMLEEPSRLLYGLGEGSFGKVYLYKDEDFQIAVKQIKIPSKLVQLEGEDVMKEVELHKSLVHPNIIQYFGAHKAKEHICIMMEHAQHGSLKQVLLRMKDSGQKLPLRQIMTFSREILMGLNYLHTRPKPVIHRDLRSPNVLIDEHFSVKIADFGISKQLKTMATTSGFSTNVGNTYWKSPEYMKGEKVGRKVDIWSFGVTILEMIYVTPPFFKSEQCKWVYSLTTNPAKPPEIPTFVDQRLQQLLSYCLTYDADKRKTAEWLLQWLTS